MRWAAWSRSLREMLWVMNIHEYQARELLAKFRAPVPAGYAAFTSEEAAAAAEKPPGPLYVVQAQHHAVGRGQANVAGAAPHATGGVRVSKCADAVCEDHGRKDGKKTERTGTR